MRPVVLASTLLLLAGCAGQGILPQEPLPPAPAGPEPAFPSFIAPNDGDDEARVLTNIEQRELEEELTRLAKQRENSVKRRIERSR